MSRALRRKVSKKMNMKSALNVKERNREEINLLSSIELVIQGIDEEEYIKENLKKSLLEQNIVKVDYILRNVCQNFNWYECSEGKNKNSVCPMFSVKGEIENMADLGTRINTCKCRLFK